MLDAVETEGERSRQVRTGRVAAGPDTLDRFSATERPRRRPPVDVCAADAAATPRRPRSPGHPASTSKAGRRTPAGRQQHQQHRNHHQHYVPLMPSAVHRRDGGRGGGTNGLLGLIGRRPAAKPVVGGHVIGLDGGRRGVRLGSRLGGRRIGQPPRTIGRYQPFWKLVSHQLFEAGRCRRRESSWCAVPGDEVEGAGDDRLGVVIERRDVRAVAEHHFGHLVGRHLLDHDLGRGSRHHPASVAERNSSTGQYTRSRAATARHPRAASWRAPPATACVGRRAR